MEENKLANKLRALAVGELHRSQTARLNDVLDDIEIALKAGVKRLAILEMLKESGYTIQMSGFESALHRLRKRRKEGSRKEVVSAVAPVQAQRATPTVTPAAGPGTTPTRGRLALPASPKRSFDWDPLERPVVEFVDDEETPDGKDQNHAKK